MTDEIKAYEDMIRYKAEKYDNLKEAVGKIKTKIESERTHININAYGKGCIDAYDRGYLGGLLTALDIVKERTDGLL